MVCVRHVLFTGLVGSYGLLGAPNELERLDQLNDIYARSEFVQNFLIYPMITFQVRKSVSIDVEYL